MVSTLTQFQLLDVVALKHNLPEHHLIAGQVGTLVEELAPNVYEVDFSDDNGQTYLMLPLHTSALLKLHYSPTETLDDHDMANNIYQYGNGDNVAGDKVMGNKADNQFSDSNIANVVNKAGDNTQINATNFTQTTGTSTAELLQLITSLRQTLAQFPPEQQEDLVIDIDDVEEEIKKPEDKRNLPKLKKRLLAIGTAATMLIGSVAAANQFIDEVNEFSSKVGIELQLPPAK